MFAVKWGDDTQTKDEKQRLLGTTILSPFHDFLEENKMPREITKTKDGALYETIDKTSAKTLVPTTYHLVG